jgi:molybdate transport repressor ModE-like protein
MRFDLTDMRLFMHVAEAGSITAGASRAHIALASASARVRGMEEALGVPLLTRGRHGVQPTPAGRTLLRHARAMLEQVERMRGELNEYAHGLKGQIRLMSNTAALSEFLPQALSRFLADHPNINIDLEERPSAKIVEAVAAGVAEVGIVADSVDSGTLETFPLRPDTLVLVTSSSHPLASKSSVTFAESVEYDHVGLVEGSALQEHLEGHAARAGMRMRYRVRLSTFEAVCRLVGRGVGVAIIPETAARRCQKATSLRRIRLTDRWASRQLKICVRSRDELPLYTRQLIDQIKT